ncbi:MAG: hypothetical protein ACRDDY_03525 [Clostridium sp.]|uniref:hypothetical protein n=1 Tax=Clostridium sp. TaxID=1506 RepID=UPI003EE72809
MLKLDLTSENYYLSKEVFNHDLTILEIRILLLLSTNIGLTVRTMSRCTKIWCYRKKQYTNKMFLDAEEKMIRLGLISQNGTGLQLKKDFLIFKDIQLFYSCKTRKQVFVLSLRCWNKKYSALIISPVVFYGIFDNRTVFKRVCESMGFKYTYQEKLNKIYIHEDVIKNNIQDLNLKTTRFVLPKVETSHYGRIAPPIEYFDL